MRITLITAIALTTLFVSTALIFQPMSASATWTFSSGFDPHGPYIDQLVWSIYPSTDIAQAMLALRLGSVDGYDERVFADQLGPLLSTPGVEVRSTLGTIYRQFTLNTATKFPSNITGWRRALAYATDKYRICDESTGGFAVPMDGAIPIPVGLYTMEGAMTEHYYAKDIVSANATLEAYNFKDVDSDGWREYDANDDGDILDPGDYDDTDPLMNPYAYCSAGYDPAIRAVSIGVAGMAECGMHASVYEITFDALIDKLESGDFNWGCFSWNINPPGEPDLLYDFFRTGQGENELFYRFHNATYDAAADNMMNASTYEDAKYWAWECQKILLENMPMVTCYNDAYIHAFRNDKWEGYVNYTGLGYMGNNYYTLTHVRLKTSAGGPYGGTYRCVLSEGMDTTNVIMSDSGYTAEVISGPLYETLWQVDPQGWAKSPCLAYNWTLATQAAGGIYQKGMKYTFHLYENATWHDGTPLTSEDVKYSLTTIWRQGPYDFDYVQNVYLVETPDTHTAIIYSNKTGWFEFSRATSLAILPKHIWKAYGDAHGGDFTGFIPTTKADMTGSGPFKWNSYLAGEYVVLDRNTNWHMGIDRPTTTTIPTDGTLLLLAGVGIAVIVIVIIAGVYYFRIRK